jgi:hypothetical protein
MTSQIHTIIASLQWQDISPPSAKPVVKNLPHLLNNFTLCYEVIPVNSRRTKHLSAAALVVLTTVTDDNSTAAREMPVISQWEVNGYQQR